MQWHKQQQNGRTPSGCLHQVNTSRHSVSIKPLVQNVFPTVWAYRRNFPDKGQEAPCYEKQEAQWPIAYGVGLRIKRSSVRIRPWPLRWALGQGSLLPLSQGEAFTLASISYLAILVKYTGKKKKPLEKIRARTYSTKLPSRLKALYFIDSVTFFHLRFTKVNLAD